MVEISTFLRHGVLTFFYNAASFAHASLRIHEAPPEKHTFRVGAICGIADPCSPTRPHFRQTEPCINFAMTKKESRGSFEGRITKEPRPSFICNYMISHLGIKFKVNIYIYGQKVSTNFDSFKNFKDICTLAVGGDFARYAFRSQGFICKKLDNYAQSNIFLPQTPKR